MKVQPVYLLDDAARLENHAKNNQNPHFWTLKHERYRCKCFSYLRWNDCFFGKGNLTVYYTGKCVQSECVSVNSESPACVCSLPFSFNCFYPGVMVSAISFKRSRYICPETAPCLHTQKEAT